MRYEIYEDTLSGYWYVVDTEKHKIVHKYWCQRYKAVETCRKLNEKQERKNKNANSQR